MKLKKLLVLSALWLSSLGVWAVDGGVWVKPELPTITEFVPFEGVASTDEAEVYLYNVEAGLFFVAGNDWGTRASLIAANNGNGAGATVPEEVKGAKVWFLTQPDGTYELKNFVEKHKGNRSAFGAADGNIWTDNDNEANRFWKVVAATDGYYITNAGFDTDKYMGWKGSYDDTRLYLLDESTAGTVWKFVSPEVYQAWAENENTKNWLTNRKIYTAAMNLKDALDKAEAIGADVADQIDVYNNTESTEAQLNAAITAVNAAIERANYNNATAANPATVTNLFIKNPSYDGDKQDNWKWTATGDGKMGMGFTAAEFYEKVFDVNQVLSDLNAGVYAVDVQAFYRPGTSDEGYKRFAANDPQIYDVKLYTVVGEDTLKTPIVTPYPEATAEKVGQGEEKEVTKTDGTKIFIPQNMDAAEGSFVKANRYHNKLFFGTDGGNAVIGLKNSSSVGGNWVLFDNWTLTYYGNGADAYQAWWDENAKFYTSLPEGTLLTNSYLAAVVGQTVSNRAEVMAKMSAIDALEENMDLWNKWDAKVKEAFQTFIKYEEKLSLDSETMLGLLDYADEEAGTNNEIRAALALSNEELVAEIAKVQALIDAVVEEAKNAVEVGQDMTTFITNPDFSEGEKGWTGWRTVWQVKWPDKSDPSRQMPKVNESCAEAFSAPNFDLYQEVEGLPLGIYEVSVQGFFRFGRGDDSWNEWNKTGEERSDYVTVEDPAKGSPVFFYVNEKATPFKNLFEEDGRTGDSPLFEDLDTPENEGRTPLTLTKDDQEVVTGVENCMRVTKDDVYLFFPDGMKSAHNYFNAGSYTQTTFSAVAHKGDKLRIGVKGRSDVGVSPDNPDSWAIFDNFKLVYRGTDKTVVKPVLEDAIVVAKAKANLAIAKDVKEQLTTAIAAAEKAVADDVDDMFSVLADLWGVDVSGSQQKVLDLKAALTPFETAINNADEADEDARPLESVISEAVETRTTAQSYVDGAVDFTNADIDAVIEKMAELTEALKVPAAMTTASDDNPANATYLITNPTYDANEDKANVKGWTLEGTEPYNYRANSGAYEVWRSKANTLVYQDLTKMPAGTYELSVQGVYRFGWADVDYKAYNEDANLNNNGKIYVKVGEAEAVEKPLQRLATLAEYYELEAVAEETEVDKRYPAKDKWIWAQEREISEDDTQAAGYIMPDQLGSTLPFFEDDSVQPTTLIFRVGEDGKARIGISIKFVQDGDWSVWDNWKLTYYGANSTKDPDVVSGVKDATALTDVVKTEVFNLSGAQVKSGKGVAIVRQTLSNGTVLVKKVIVK